MENINDLHLKKLFPKEIVGEIDILTFLYQNSDGVYIKDIIKHTHLHRKTIYKYINDINDISLNHFGSPYIVLSEKNKYMFIKSKLEYLTLRFLIYESVPITNLISQFSHTSNINLYYFCLKYHISEHSFKAQIKTLTYILKNYNIYLNIRAGEIYIKGDEAKIRYLLVTFFWRLYRGLKWPFYIDRNKLLDNTLLVLQKLSELSYSKKEILLYFFAINIQRSKSEHYIQHYRLPSYSTILCQTFLNNFSKDFLLKYTLSAPELEFNVLIFCAFLGEFINFKYMDTIVEMIRDNQLESYHSIINFLNYVQERDLNWKLRSYNGQLFYSVLISSRIFIDIFKDIYFNVYDLHLNRHASINYPSLLPSLEIVIIKYHSYLSKSEIKALTFRYAEAYITAFPPHDFEPKINILVSTDIPLYIENLLIRRLTSVLSDRFNISISAAPQNQSDLIIATGLVHPELSEHRIVHVYPHLTHENIIAILSSCSEILNEKIKKSIP